MTDDEIKLAGYLFAKLQEANKNRIKTCKESFTYLNVVFIILNVIKQQIEAMQCLKI